MDVIWSNVKNVNRHVYNAVCCVCCRLKKIRTKNVVSQKVVHTHTHTHPYTTVEYMPKWKRTIVGFLFLLLLYCQYSLHTKIAIISMATSETMGFTFFLHIQTNGTTHSVFMKLKNPPKFSIEQCKKNSLKRTHTDIQTSYTYSNVMVEYNYPWTDKME